MTNIGRVKDSRNRICDKAAQVLGGRAGVLLEGVVADLPLDGHNLAQKVRSRYINI